MRQVLHGLCGTNALADLESRTLLRATRALVAEERDRTLSGLPHLAREVMVAAEAGCLDANSMPTQLLGSLVKRLQQPKLRTRLTEAEQYFYGMLLNSGNVSHPCVDFP